MYHFFLWIFFNHSNGISGLEARKHIGSLMSKYKTLHIEVYIQGMLYLILWKSQFRRSCVWDTFICELVYRISCQWVSDKNPCFVPVTMGYFPITCYLRGRCSRSALSNGNFCEDRNVLDLGCPLQYSAATCEQL